MKNFVSDNRNKIVWTLLAVLYAGIVAWASATQVTNMKTFADHEVRLQALEKQNASMSSDMRTLLRYAQDNRTSILNIESGVMKTQENLMQHMSNERR
jgi:hypothetical protein